MALYMRENLKIKIMEKKKDNERITKTVIFSVVGVALVSALCSIFRTAVWIKNDNLITKKILVELGSI
jgi:hypothetical protein